MTSIHDTPVNACFTRIIPAAIIICNMLNRVSTRYVLHAVIADVYVDQYYYVSARLATHALRARYIDFFSPRKKIYYTLALRFTKHCTPANMLERFLKLLCLGTLISLCNRVWKCSESA